MRFSKTKLGRTIWINLENPLQCYKCKTSVSNMWYYCEGRSNLLCRECEFLFGCNIQSDHVDFSIDNIEYPNNIPQKLILNKEK